MADSLGIPVLAFLPMVGKQEPATPFREAIDEDGAAVVPRPLHNPFVAEPEKVGVELAPASEWQSARNLTGVMPAPVAERFEHQELQLAAPPHTAILADLVSTFSFVTDLHREARGVRGMAKASTFKNGSRTGIFSRLFLNFCKKKGCKQCPQNTTR